MVGKTISHYKITSKLGEGGMGVVYLAQDLKLDRQVALKFLPEHLTADEVEKERFIHEARAASSLNHSNITTIYEIDEFEGQLFFAMEYCPGRNIKELIEKDKLILKKTLDIAIQICEGLTAAHDKEVVHRDIKSENIMITPEGRAKIMDFGLAKLKGASKITSTGSTVGTVAYMSPEQAQGMDVDRRSDIFSFGVVLYEMISSHLPFKGEHEAAVIYSIVNETPEPLARYKADVPEGLQRIVTKALTKDLE
ncbi:serine/threonine protein kinase, partial [Candidatus Zixiibacteriota bacterium]